MAALTYVSLIVNNHSPSSTPNDSIAVSSSLVEGTNYLILGWGQHRGGGTSDTSSANLLVGPSGSRVAFSRSRNNSAFNPSNSLASLANGANTPFACGFTYTAGSSDQMELHHWTSDGTGESRFNVFAIDIDPLTEIYHEESANSDTIASTPTSGWETVGSALTETVAAGDYILLAYCEAVDSGSAESGNEIAARVTVDGSEQINSRVQQNASTTDDDIYGYMFVRVLTLGAGEHTFAVQGDGTASGGNIGFRRVRIHLIPVSQIEDDDVQQTLDPGHTVSGISSADVCPTTIDPSASRDYLVFAQYQLQQANWSEGYIAVDDVNIQDGFGAGPIDNGVGTADDMTRVEAMELVTGVSSSTTLEIRLNKVAGGGGTNHAFAGEDSPRAANDSAPADISLIAIRLATEDSAATHELSGSATGSAVAEADLERIAELSASAVGEAVASADLERIAELSASAIGVGVADADLEVLTPGGTTFELAGSAIGQGVVTGDASVLLWLSAAAIGVGVASADLTVESPDATTHELSGLATGRGVASAALNVSVSLIGSAIGQGLAFADLTHIPLQIAGLSMTTATALREAITTAIEAITPVEEVGYRYRRVSMKSEVAGTGFRNFFVEFGIPQAVTNGIYGTGVEVECQMDVYMNYSHRPDEGEEGLISSDGHEIWIQLMRRLDPEIAGLMNVEQQGWSDESDDPGHRWGSHRYTVKFFARGLLA